MPKPKRRSPAGKGHGPPARPKPPGLRIIGGTFRGRRLQYSGDFRVRPMKDRVREAIFNLIGPAMRGKHALDLFAGTGALGLEATSRGAAGATFIECHYPTAAVLKANIATLDAQSICRVVVADTFVWLDQTPVIDDTSWLVFISPPYDYFVGRTDDMLRLIEAVYAAAPPESILVVESDQRFDPARLPDAASWDVRNYPPARVALCHKEPGPQSPIPNP